MSVQSGTRGLRSRPPAASPSAGSRDRVHLYKLDARQVLAALPARSISVLITDPPYQTVRRTAGSRFLRQWFAKSLSWPEIGRALALVRAKMRPDGIALVMTNSDGLRPAIEALERAGFSRVRPIVWDKRTPGLGGGLRHQTEYVLIGYLPGSRTLTGVDLVSVPSVGPGTRGRYPTEKPADLGRALAAIARIGRGDIVVDPFCGSGALLIGARERGAQVIGCDVAAGAIKRATSRLTDVQPVKLAAAPRRRTSAPTGGRVGTGARARATVPATPKPRPTRPPAAGPGRRSP
jgi:site-specific DNA-methyltransferase (adenine-specific)